MQVVSLSYARRDQRLRFRAWSVLRESSIRLRSLQPHHQFDKFTAPAACPGRPTERMAEAGGGGAGAGAGAPAARDVSAKHKHSALVVTVIEAENLTNCQMIAAQVRHAVDPRAASGRFSYTTRVILAFPCGTLPSFSPRR